MAQCLWIVLPLAVPGAVAGAVERAVVVERRHPAREVPQVLPRGPPQVVAGPVAVVTALPRRRGYPE